MSVIAAVDPTVFAAFTAGLLSFASPCVLPLVPGYLSAISGVPVGAAAAPRTRAEILWPAVTFCLAFTTIFVALGLLATGLGAPLSDNRDLLNKLSGGLLIAFGVFLLACLAVPGLNRDKRSSTLIEKAGSGGPLVAGAAFAVAWTPCTGPILGAILTRAAQGDGLGGGAFLLTSYSLGLAVPFLGAALAFERFSAAFRWLRDHYAVVTVISGLLLIGVGLLVYNNEMTRLAAETRSLLDSAGINLRFFER